MKKLLIILFVLFLPLSPTFAANPIMLGGGTPAAGGCTTVKQTYTTGGGATGFGDQAISHCDAAGVTFTATSSYTLCKATIQLWKTGAPDYTITVSLRIWGDLNTVVSTFGTIESSTLGTSAEEHTFTLGTPYDITDTVRYMIVATGGTGSATDYCFIGWLNTGTEAARYHTDVWISDDDSATGYLILYSE